MIFAVKGVCLQEMEATQDTDLAAQQLLEAFPPIRPLHAESPSAEK